jgi:hypothetical protein
MMPLSHKLCFVPLLILFSMSGLKAQTYIYEGSYFAPAYVLCNVEQGRVFEGISRFSGDVLLRTDGEFIFKGNTLSGFDLLYAFRDGKLYLGDSRFSSDMIYNVESGRIYRGNSNMGLDLMYSFSSNSIFEKDGISNLDVVLSFDNELKPIEILMVLLALEML